MNDPHLKSNQSLWDGLTPIHEKSAFYDVAGFKAGQTSLKAVELEELGDVTGKTLLHLQCHFGLDTLSWARLGARATGVDFSEKSVALARALSEETGVGARFIQSDIYDLPAVLDEQFDIVFTSYGVLCWLPDLPRWAQLVARYLKPGGTFYIVEFHPFDYMFDYDSGEALLKYPYFRSTQPLELEGSNDYADPSADFRHTSYEWPYPLSDIVNALISAGLRLEFLHEFPYSSHDWRTPAEIEANKPQINNPEQLPLMFSIRATR